MFSLLSSLDILGTSPLLEVYKYFLPNRSLSFHPFNGVFSRIKVFRVDVVQFINLFIFWSIFLVFKNVLPGPRSQRCGSSIFFPLKGFTFKYMIHFELVFA